LTCVDPQAFPDWSDSALVLDLPAGLLTSPHEPEARYAQKRGKDWVGYKTHITETVAGAGEIGNFITAMTVTAAAVHDIQRNPLVFACTILKSICNSNRRSVRLAKAATRARDQRL
jgi:hypothetical protein